MTTDKYLISIDIGTSHTKAMLGKIDGKVLDIAIEDYEVLYPEPNMVEQDPDEVLDAVINSIKIIIQKNNLSHKNIIAFVFGGILHSLLPIDKNGKKLSNAIIWADTRSMKESDHLRNLVNLKDIRYRTGCTIHPLYYLPKLLWLKKNANSIFKKTWKFISIKEYIIFKLFNKLLVDRSTASGTGIWNMHTLTWDEELLDIINLNPDHFSPVVETTTIIRGLKKSYAKSIGIDDTTAVVGSSDGPLAHLGSVGLTRKNISLTIGTGAAIRILIDQPDTFSNNETWCYYLTDNKWLIGGVVHDAGLAINWLIKDLMGIYITKDTFNSIDKEAGKIAPGSEGLLFLPYLGGERSPNYKPAIRGTILGLSYNHTKAHLVRALMEGISYRLYTVYQSIVKNMNKGIVITGGILKSPNWLQIIADLFGKNLLIPRIKEASAFGGILLGLKAFNIINLNKINSMINYKEKITYNPNKHQKYAYIIDEYNNQYANLY